MHLKKTRPLFKSFEQVDCYFVDSCSSGSKSIFTTILKEAEKMNFVFHVTVSLIVMFGIGFSAGSNYCKGGSHLLFVI